MKPVVFFAAICGWLGASGEHLMAAEGRMIWESIGCGSGEVSIQNWRVMVNGAATGACCYRVRMNLPLSDAADQAPRVTALVGVARLVQRPDRRTKHTARVWFQSSNGRSVMEMEYQLYPHTWFDAPLNWWSPRETVHIRGVARRTVLLTCRGVGCVATPDAGVPADRITFRTELPAKDYSVVARVTSRGWIVKRVEPPSASNGGATEVWLEKMSDFEATSSSLYALTLVWMSEAALL